MGYKDKAKQREAVREAVRRHRQGITQKAKEQGITDLEKCRYCGEPLPRLEQPRKHPGACYPCAIKQPAKPRLQAVCEQRPGRYGHTKHPIFHPDYEYTGPMLTRKKYNDVMDEIVRPNQLTVADVQEAKRRLEADKEHFVKL